jgi:hypothetical protein
MMNLARRSFRRMSMNMEMIRWRCGARCWACTYYFYYGDGRPLSHTYYDEPRSRRIYI